MYGWFEKKKKNCSNNKEMYTFKDAYFQTIPSGKKFGFWPKLKNNFGTTPYCTKGYLKQPANAQNSKNVQNLPTLL